MNIYILCRYVVLLSNYLVLVTPYYSNSQEKYHILHKTDHFRRLSTGTHYNLQQNSFRDILNKTIASRRITQQCSSAGAVFDFLTSSLDWNPESSDEINVKYIFYSRNQTPSSKSYMTNMYRLETVPPEFDPEKQTVFIVHGFKSFANASWVNDMADAFLEWGDVNVIVVDWSKGCSSWKYWRAVANTRTVGEDLNQFLKFMIAEAGLQPSKLHLIGHSLGAHVCSYASQGIRGIKRITGLDPAHLCFGTPEVGSKLGKSDADFVDVIHTNAGPQLLLYLGLPEPMGHADFYPNGGSQQPGCTEITAGDNGLSNVINRAVCDHGRAYAYFTETLRHPDCGFLAKPWDPNNKDNKPEKCASPKSLEDLYTSATPKDCALMGMPADRTRPNGTYYVETSHDAPWCQFVDESELTKTTRVMQFLWNLFPQLRAGADVGESDLVLVSRRTLRNYNRSNK